MVESLGAEKLVYLKLGENTISILVPSEEKIKSGENLQFSLRPEALHLFNYSNQSRITSNRND